jgi:transposase-like protein
MSNTTNKASSKGVRYTDAQKKEVVDFTVDYNSANGRGGQSKASEKFNVSQLTISGWLKAAGASASKAPKAAKASKVAKAPKAAKAAKGKVATKTSSRYTPEQKQEVIDFVIAYNKANGRGGPSNASKKFSISPLTVVAWLKAAGETTVKNSSRKGDKVAKAAKPAKGAAVTKSNSGSGSINTKLASLLALSTEIADAETKLAQLQAKFSSLKASL